MQQTENLKLNLIEGTDAVDWEVLNENFETLEAETAGIRETFSAAMGSGGSTARIAYGSYTGGGGAKTLTFPFKPVFVAIGGGNVTGASTTDIFMIQGAPQSSYNDFAGAVAKVTWGGSGGNWTVTFSYTDSQVHNATGKTYYYVAVGVSE